VLRLAWADYLSFGSSLAGRERAVRISAEPAFLERLAAKQEEEGSDPEAALREGARLEPSNPSRWLRLAAVAEWNGETEFAGRCLHRAAGLSRLYQPRYLLAQYYFRRQDQPAFLYWAHAAFEVAYGDVSPLLDLCWRMQPDPASFARQGLTTPPAVRRQFLTVLLQRRQTAAATILAQPLSQTGSSDDLAILFGFCDVVLSEGKSDPALSVWNTLCHRNLAHSAPLSPERGQSLTDPDFRGAALGTVFGWRVEPSAGVVIRRTPGAWQATLSGSEAETSLLAWQYVPLLAKRRYRIRLESSPIDAPSADGISWSVFYPTASGIWKEWMPARGPEFLAPAEVVRVAITYRRPLGAARLAGTISIRGVDLELMP
jgi:hypothetical protein